MAKAGFKTLIFILLGALLSMTSWAGADTTTGSTIHAPCLDGTPTAAGLRACSAYIPQLVTQISQNGAAYPVPLPTPSQSPIAGMMQYYASAAYQGIDLDTSGTATTLPGNFYPGNNFGKSCALVPSTLNHNQTETTTVAAINNPSTPSCGTEMKITVQGTACVVPTNEQAALLKNLGTSTTQIDGLNAEEAQALLAKAAAANPNVVGTSAGGSLCINLDSSGLDSKNGPGSLERNYLRGTYVQALSHYTDVVLNQLQCQHTITVPSTSCQAFTNKTGALIELTQANFTVLQPQLTAGSVQAQMNLKDINNCNISNFSSSPTSGGDPAVLRQSAQHLCSARAALETAFSELVMCDILSQAQADYFVNTGSTSAQLNILNTMDLSFDQICRPQCQNSKSLASLGTCLQGCYHTQMPLYLTNQFQKFWPQVVPMNSATCVAGGSNGQ